MISFVFQNVMMLWLLLPLFPLAGLLHHARSRRKLVIAEMGRGLAPTFARRRDYWRLAALSLLIAALARPGFDPQSQSMSRSGRDVIFVLDVSRSMLAGDAAPNRLEAAKNGIRDALDSFDSEQVGLVIYAGSANILCPLTHDYHFIRHMLDQATTRAVDFGGTVLLSAVEKCVDNVLIDGREGMHDLIVLTDGEEHGAENKQVARLLKEKRVGLLVIGLGDSTAGSRIPIEEAGKSTHVMHEGEYVTTRLQDSELRELVGSIPGAEYRSPGAASFDLAGIYADYSADKPRSATGNGEDAFVTYREAGFALMALALVFLLIGERPVHLALTTALLGFFIPANADQTRFESEFAKAIEHQQSGRFEEALEAFAMIEKEGAAPVSNRDCAVIRFNEGLCFLAQATQQGAAEPRMGMALARQAQNRFLAARRLAPTLQRAGQRLDPTAQMIQKLQERIDEEDRRQEAIQDQIQKLVEMLQTLHKNQTALRDRVPQLRSGQTSPPDGAGPNSTKWSSQQKSLQTEGQTIHGRIIDLDKAISPAGMDPAATVFHEPRLLMAETVATMGQAHGHLQQWMEWPEARVQQQIALDKIKEIIDLLSSGNSGQSEEGDREDEEDWENMEPTDSEDGMNTSISSPGNLAAESEMQSLPTPNYSVQDILQQEQGSLQFRQQQRAAQNKGKVAKDW